MANQIDYVSKSEEYKSLLTKTAQYGFSTVVLVHTLSELPEWQTEDYKKNLLEDLKKQNDILYNDTRTAIDLFASWRAQYLTAPISVVAMLGFGITFAFTGNPVHLCFTLLTILWSTYEKKRTKKKFEGLSTHMEKNVQRSYLAAQGLVSRVLETRSTDNK